MKLWLSFLFFIAAPTVLLAQTDKATLKPGAAESGKSDTKKPAKAPASEDEKIAAVLDPMPAGQVFNGLVIPSLGPNGQIQSLFKAESAKRIGDRDMEMTNLQIEIHNDDGTTFHVQMAHSVFNFDTKILTSDTPTTIKRNDFVINGDRAEFNVKSRFGRMLGNVKMTIFSTGGDTTAPQRNRPRKDNAANAAATPTPTPTSTPQ